jgi:hypothetical protein
MRKMVTLGRRERKNKIKKRRKEGRFIGLVWKEM